MLKSNKDILIVGGAGIVGRKVVAILAPDYPDRVIIAGRDVEKASRIASEIGFGVCPRHIDVADREVVEKAMEDVGTVLSCVAQPATPHLLLASVAQGCGYTDIAPKSLSRPPYSDALKAEAVNNGARIILGAGLIPGISNIFARMGAEHVGPVVSVESACLLSLGDEYGTDSRGFIAEEVATKFKAMINGSQMLVRPFSRPKRIQFQHPVGELTAYCFPFSDQIFYPATLGARTAITRLALMPQWAGGLFAVLLPFVGTALSKRQPGSSGGRVGGIMDLLKRKYKGLDWWGVQVDVEGGKGMLHASIQGHDQARATAISASAFVRSLIEGGVQEAGIKTADQVVPVAPFLERLASHGLIPTINLSIRT